MKKNQEIKQYWDQKATTTKEYIPDITMKDICLRELEIESIINLLKSYGLKDVIDIGCGNGYSTFRFNKYAQNILGVDYSEEMIKKCIENQEMIADKNISFQSADVLELSEIVDKKFDVAITERCLINVPNFEDQKLAITQIHNVLNPKGKFLMLEGIQETFDYLNNARIKAGLDIIKLDWHNILFKTKEFETYISDMFRIVQVIDFGVYYYISRIFHPLFVAPEEPKFTSKINEVARQLSILGNPDFEKYSILKLYVLEKK